METMNIAKMFEMQQILRWKQIERAYMDKNAVNHQRQEQGY